MLPHAHCGLAKLLDYICYCEVEGLRGLHIVAADGVKLDMEVLLGGLCPAAVNLLREERILPACAFGFGVL